MEALIKQGTNPLVIKAGTQTPSGSEDHVLSRLSLWNIRRSPFSFAYIHLYRDSGRCLLFLLFPHLLKITIPDKTYMEVMSWTNFQLPRISQ